MNHDEKKERRRPKVIQRNIRRELERRKRLRSGEYIGTVTLLRQIREQSLCIDCGEDDPDVLDFDHVRGKKLFNLSMTGVWKYSLDNVIKELEKCEMRCSNCHRKRHARERRIRRWGVADIAELEADETC